jgi:membrane protease YdiL (CAAX protease family)
VNLESTNQTQATKKNARLALFWTILGTLGALAVFPYQLALNPSAVAQVPVPLPVLVIAQTAQTCLLLLLLSWLGLRLGQSIGLDSPFARAWVYGLEPPSVSHRALVVASLTGAVGGLVIRLLDRLFQPFMPPTTHPTGGNIELWKRLLASFYGGITEELLLRLFLMTLIAWIIWKIACKGRAAPTAVVFWIAIVVAAVLFGVGHLPATASVWPLTTIVVVRAIALNGLAGLAFGFFYWRWGLEHAMLAHFCADIALHGVGGG